MPKRNAFLEAALEYAAMGYAVFPLRPRDKRPITEHGFLDATTDEDTIEAWWKETPLANVGISTEGLVVIDVDGPENPWPGDDELAAEISSCPCQSTPRGGRHYLMRPPEDKRWRSSTSKLAPGLDIRADGGYIVAAPSLGVGKGARYTWQLPLVARNELPLVPDWIAARLDEIAKTGGWEGRRSFLGEEPIVEGTRDNTLTQIAGWLRRHGFGQEEILATLGATNRLRCRPALENGALIRISKSAMRWEPDMFATGAMEGDILTSGAPPEAEFPDPGPFPPHLLDEVPGLMSDVIDYCLQTAIRPQPIYALAGAVALMSALTGRRLSDQTNLRTNLLCLAIGMSGSGKNRPREVNQQILSEAKGARQFLGSETLQSGNGLYTVVRSKPACLLQLDEIGKMLLRIKTGKSDPLATVIPSIMHLYSSAGVACTIGGWVDPRREYELQQPHVVVLGTTVLESFTEGLTSTSLNDGFLSRTLLFYSRDFPLEQEYEWRDTPPGVLEKVAEWAEFPGGNLTGINPKPRRVVYTPGAKGVFRDFRTYCDKFAKDHSLWTRTSEKAKKLAMLYAASRFGTAVIEVCEKAAKWGCGVTEHSTREMLYLAGEYVTGTALGDLTNQIFRWLKKRRTWTTGSDFANRWRGVKKHTRDEILKTLQEAGQVEIQKTARGFRIQPRTAL